MTVKPSSHARLERPTALTTWKLFSAFEPPLHILLVSAEPDGQPQLDVDTEPEQIVQAMDALQTAGKVQIEALHLAPGGELAELLAEVGYEARALEGGALRPLDPARIQQRPVCGPEGQLIGVDQVAEIVIVNNDPGTERLAGVRTEGSGLNRTLALHEPEGGDLDLVTMLVKAGNGATIERR